METAAEAETDSKSLSCSRARERALSHCLLLLPGAVARAQVTMCYSFLNATPEQVQGAGRGRMPLNAGVFVFILRRRDTLLRE